MTLICLRSSLRIGLLSFTLAFALLTGNPVAGALLSPPKYKWHQPLIFAAVSHILESKICANHCVEVVTLAGAVCALTARSALVKRKGTRIL